MRKRVVGASHRAVSGIWIVWYPFYDIDVEHEMLTNNKQASPRRHSRRKKAKKMSRWSRL